VAAEAFHFFMCGLGDLGDILGITDGSHREVGARVERRGREAGVDPVGEPFLLANAIPQARRERVAAQNEIGHDESGGGGVVVLEWEYESGRVRSIGPVGGVKPLLGAWRL